MTGAELKAWRAREGLTQSAAAKALGCDRAALANWESGRRAMPDDVAAKTGEPVAPREVAKAKAAKLPAKVRGVPASELAKIAGGEVERLAPQPRPHGVPKEARRPTVDELKRAPSLYGGPNVWVEPKPVILRGREVAQATVYRCSITGHGSPSLQLVRGEGAGQAAP